MKYFNGFRKASRENWVKTKGSFCPKIVKAPGKLGNRNYLENDCKLIYLLASVN
jgi:hypothetical protein